MLVPQGASLCSECSMFRMSGVQKKSAGVQKKSAAVQNVLCSGLELGLEKLYLEFCSEGKPNNRLIKSVLACFILIVFFYKTTKGEREG